MLLSKSNPSEKKTLRALGQALWRAMAVMTRTTNGVKRPLSHAHAADRPDGSNAFHTKEQQTETDCYRRGYEAGKTWALHPSHKREAECFAAFFGFDRSAAADCGRYHEDDANPGGFCEPHERLYRAIFPSHPDGKSRPEVANNARRFFKEQGWVRHDLFDPPATEPQGRQDRWLQGWAAAVLQAQTT